MKNKRTRQYNPDGTTIYNTFNATGLTPRYKNINARFDTKYGTKDTPTDQQRDSCTIAGCGKQCCTSTILLSDISGVQIWRENFDYGRILKPGGSVCIRSSIINPATNKPYSPIRMGNIEDIVISNTNDCIAIPPENEIPFDCSGAFPINIEIMTTPGPEGCQLIDITRYNMLYIQQPGMQDEQFVHTIEDNIITRVPGTGRVGAPYRAPLAGARKSLDCCNYLQKGCIGKCYLKFGFEKILPPGTPRVGDHVYYQTHYIGEVVLVNLFSSSHSYPYYILISPIFDPTNNLDCHSKKLPFNPNKPVVLTDILHQIYQKVTFLGYDTEQCIIKPTPENNIYKDPSVKSCGKDNRVCYNGRIRSGMQPKQQFCITYKKVSENSYKKKKKLLCATDIGFQKPYSYSYSQYNKNRALNTYERGLERNIPANGSGDTSCPPGSCLKSLYRKSAGNSCINCELSNKPSQTLTLDQITVQIPPGTNVYEVDSNISPQPAGNGIGKVATSKVNQSGVYTDVEITLTGDSFITGTKALLFNAPQEFVVPSLYLTNISDPIVETAPEYNLSKAKAERKRMSRNSMTVWKPSNDKFKVQGAVTAGGRLERLKLDTIKSANSKCQKGQRCDQNKIPNGLYFAGKPRFTGWMFNKRHHEVVCENKYRQQPLGIPQLTYKGRSTRSNKPPSSWKDKSEGTYGLYQRDTITTRAPACKCSKKTCPAWLCQGENLDDFPANNARYQISNCRTNVSSLEKPHILLTAANLHQKAPAVGYSRGHTGGWPAGGSSIVPSTLTETKVLGLYTNDWPVGGMPPQQLHLRLNTKGKIPDSITFSGGDLPSSYTLSLSHAHVKPPTTVEYWVWFNNGFIFTPGETYKIFFD